MQGCPNHGTTYPPPARKVCRARRCSGTLGGMRYNLPENLDRLAQSQCGVLSAQQAMAGGMTRDMIRARVRNRRWPKLQCGVYATFSGEPAPEAVLWAAVLRARSGAELIHYTPP